jgi:hypothetical protein
MKIQSPVIGLGSLINNERVVSIDGTHRTITLMNESGVRSSMNFSEVEVIYEHERQQKQQ